MGDGLLRPTRAVDHVVRCCAQGYISAEELLNIPELSINPLTRRLERIFDSVNFKVSVCPLLPGACSGDFYQRQQ